MTLTELMVVLAIIGVLAALILMSVARTKPSARQTVCINNQKQLILTWAQWANDNNDRLVPARPALVDGERVAWVKGFGHTGYRNGAFVTNWGSMTNKLYLSHHTNAAFAPYLKRLKVYKCPESNERIKGMETIRSYSMNQYMGSTQTDPDWTHFEEKADIPEPSQFFVFADQNDKFICWPAMMIRMSGDYWINLPAIRHSYGATLSFADGHVEYHKWREKTTRGHPDVHSWLQAQWPNHGTQAQTNDFDLAWLRQRSTVRKNQ